ncbi:MAG: hypothetical protein IJ880_04785 [Bacilli bacterium]|nr:hypothetical protein [Bacilli bacterium]MBR3119738.1 hypothetical protein [Oceanobacillus sp.]
MTFFALLIIVLVGVMFIASGKKSYDYGTDGAVLILMGWGLIIFAVIMIFMFGSL